MLLGEGMTEVAIIIIQSTIRTIIKGKSKILSIILNANGNNKHLNNSKVDVCTKFFPSGFKESCRRKNSFQSQRIRRIWKIWVFLTQQGQCTYELTETVLRSTDLQVSAPGRFPALKREVDTNPHFLPRSYLQLKTTANKKWFFFPSESHLSESTRVDCMSSTRRARIKGLDGILGVLCLIILNQGILKVIVIDLYL